MISKKDIFYSSINNRISKNLTAIKNKLNLLNRDEWQILGFGASHSTTTLLHMLNSDKNLIDYILDDNKIKQGRYSPGYNLPVLDPSNLSNMLEKKIFELGWSVIDS